MTGEVDSNQGQPPAVISKPDSGVKRVREWFWRGAALAEKKRSLPAPNPRAVVLTQRARSSADLAVNCADLARSGEVARSSMTPPEPIETSADACTAELYRQSVYWGLCALAAASDETAGTRYDAALWDTLDEQLLRASATGEERVARLRESLRDGSFVYFAELPASEQTAVGQDLAKLSAAVLEVLDRRNRELQTILMQRAWRLGLIFLLLLLVGAVGAWERKTRDERHDLAVGKPWRASSKFEDLGCKSPKQECPESTQVFFCTAEQKDPWIEFDLETVQDISAIQAENRPDCCAERAIPLIVEVSDNHKDWKTVARRDTDFTSWRGTFPTVKARWVRLRVPRVSFLHLKRVRILP